MDGMWLLPVFGPKTVPIWAEISVHATVSYLALGTSLGLSTARAGRSSLVRLGTSVGGRR
jgi:hypothetical protein